MDGQSALATHSIPHPSSILTCFTTDRSSDPPPAAIQCAATDPSLCSDFIWRQIVQRPQHHDPSVTWIQAARQIDDERKRLDIILHLGWVEPVVPRLTPRQMAMDDHVWCAQDAGLDPSGVTETPA